MMFYGKTETWKILYYPKKPGWTSMGVAFVEADCHHTAMQVFCEQYAGLYSTIYRCEKLIK